MSVAGATLRWMSDNSFNTFPANICCNSYNWNCHVWALNLCYKITPDFDFKCWSVGRENNNRTVSVLSYCVAFQRCTIVRAVLWGWSTGSGFDLVGPSSQSSKHLSIFGYLRTGALWVFEIILTVTSLYHVEGLALYPVDWPTIVLQCFDSVGWVIWPVKSSPIWPIVCLVGR